MTQLARPLPVEYLLVDLGAAFPVEPQYTFKKAEKPFPVENRNAVGDTQVSSGYIQDSALQIRGSNMALILLTFN